VSKNASKSGEQWVLAHHRPPATEGTTMNRTPDRQPGRHDHTPPLTDPRPAIPSPLSERRTTHRRRTRTSRTLARGARVPWPTTVWPCANDDRREGTGVISAWLHTAVVKIVTTYTRPGDRVLLLVPPTPLRTARWPGSSVSQWPGRYAGLHEAAWTVVRLGRSVQTQTAPNSSPPPPADPPLRSVGVFDTGGQTESGPGPTRGSASCHPRTKPRQTESARPEHPDRRISDADPTGFELIIAAVYPRATDWLRTATWAGQLRRHGLLTVITHSDHVEGRLVDPTPAILGAARYADLAYLDHIALLEIPTRRGRLAAAHPATATAAGHGDAAADPKATAPARPPALIRVHSDLLVFGHGRDAAPGATAIPTQETSDV
jgi:hypothetical protein